MRERTYVHEVTHFTIEMWYCWRLIKQNMLDSFDCWTSEEMKPLTVYQEMSFSMEEHISRSSHFVIL